MKLSHSLTLMSKEDEVMNAQFVMECPSIQIQQHK